MSGPTNSGKTYQALQSLTAGASGVYCGPLRLLAWEVHEKLNDGKLTQRPVPCDLITGQERVIVPNAQHRSSTIEMVDMKRVVDVAVIDEVQMLASADRGWAWTRALLGLPAAEIHVCGEQRSIELVRRLCGLCGDSLEVHEYQRLTPLVVAKKSLNSSLRNVKGGDAVVAFSRRQIHQLKKDIEALTPHRCSVVYGSLPPATRKEQARMFNGSPLARQAEAMAARVGGETVEGTKSDALVVKEEARVGVREGRVDELQDRDGDGGGAGEDTGKQGAEGDIPMHSVLVASDAVHIR